MSVAEFGPFDVRWRSGPLDDVLFSLLGGPVSSERDAVIGVDVRPADAPAARPVGPEAFFLGEASAYVEGDRIVVWDGVSRAEVASDGSTISLSLHPASLGEQSAFRTHAAPAMLAVAARARGVFHMHAALVTFRGVPVLIVGQGNVGKTTTALSLVECGGRWGGDDLALFAAGADGRVLVWGVPREFHLRERTAALFPAIAARGTHRRVRGESRVDVSLTATHGARRLSGPVEPALVVVPRVVDADRSEAEWLPSGAAFGDALHSSAMIVANELGHQQQQMDLLGRLLGAARSVEIRLGRDGLSDGSSAARALGRLLDE